MEIILYFFIHLFIYLFMNLFAYLQLKAQIEQVEASVAVEVTEADGEGEDAAAQVGGGD